MVLKKFCNWQKLLLIKKTNQNEAAVLFLNTLQSVTAISFYSPGYSSHLLIKKISSENVIEVYLYCNFMPIRELFLKTILASFFKYKTLEDDIELVIRIIENHI